MDWTTGPGMDNWTGLATGLTTKSIATYVYFGGCKAKRTYRLFGDNN